MSSRSALCCWLNVCTCGGEQCNVLGALQPSSALHSNAEVTVHQVTVQRLQCIGWTFNLWWMAATCRLIAAPARSSPDNCFQSKLLHVTVSSHILKHQDMQLGSKNFKWTFCGRKKRPKIKALTFRRNPWKEALFCRGPYLSGCLLCNLGNLDLILCPTLWRIQYGLIQYGMPTTPILWVPYG